MLTSDIFYEFKTYHLNPYQVEYNVYKNYRNDKCLHALYVYLLMVMVYQSTNDIDL